MDWTKQKTLVTGGASFIGSHLVDALLEPLINPVNHGVFVLPEEILLFCEVIL